MPLASSRTASQKRAAAAKAEKEEEERRRRISMPKTIPSTTRVTRDSVKRRRNSRAGSVDKQKKQRSDASVNSTRSTKENQDVEMAIAKDRANERGGGGHSPPITRSAKKKPPLGKGRSTAGVVLDFSPPNQQLNAQLEKERLAKEDEEHKMRVAQAADEGRYLEYSPNSFRCRNFKLGDENVEEEDGPAMLADDQEQAEANKTRDSEESPASNGSEISDMSMSKTQQTNNPEIQADLKEMKDMLAGLTGMVQQGSTAANKEEMERVKQELQVALANQRSKVEELTKANDKLNQKNEILTKQMVESKEAFLVETTQLKAELEQKRESLQQKLQQVVELEDELKLLQKANENESHAMEDVMQRLQMVKQSEESLQQEKLALENDLKDLRECETQLQDALLLITQYEEQAAKTKQDLEQHENNIKELQTRISLLQKQKNDSETTNNSLNETIQMLQKELEQKDLKIDELTKETGKISSLNQENHGFQGKISELEAKLAENGKHLQDYEERLELTKKKEKETQQELEKEQEQLSERVRDQQLRIMELEKELQTSQNEHNAVKGRLETFDTRENTLYQKLVDSERIRQSLHARVMELCGNIRVFCRVRPLLSDELNAPAPVEKIANSKRKKKTPAEPVKEESPWHFPGDYGDRSGVSNLAGSDDLTKKMVEITEPYKDRGGLSDRRKKWRFGFDNVFPPSASQNDIWEASEPLVQSAIDGYNATIMAYGQTGSGKTYTMLGDEDNKGIIARSVEKMFKAKQELEALSRGAAKIQLSVELIEIYNEEVRDLLSSSPVSGNRLKVTSNDIVGNVVVATESTNEVMQVLELAQGRRCVKATESNAQSSRSHMLFTLHFEAALPGGITRSGKLNVCDLAGSERLAKSGANAVVGGDLLKETKSINSSLSVLSNVIEKLQAGSSSIPYRESKLTFILQNSLGGSSKTLMIVCANPHVGSFHESLCTLRFAEKVNKVELKAMANFSC